MTEFQHIFDAFNKWGFKGGLLALITIIILVFIKSDSASTLLSKVIDKVFTSKKNKKEEVLLKETDITQHEIFNYIDFWIYSSIPTLVFKSEYRTEVFRKYLSIYFREYSKSLSQFVTSAKYKDMSNTEIKHHMFNLLNDVVRDYEREMITSGIPDVIINKMKSKNNETFNLTLELISSVCDSPFYDTDRNLLKVFSILNILLSTLDYTMSISDDICNSINGELKGKTFNGKTEI